MATKKNSNGAKYTVETYFELLRTAGRSEKTIIGYRKVFQMYAKCLNVPLDKIHQHLSVENLLKFAGSRNTVTDKSTGATRAASQSGKKTALSVMRRYAKLNGVVFDDLEFNALKPKTLKENNDKPLELDTLQKMMDLTDVHGRALLSFMVSTGCRPDEACQILLSDIGVTTGNEEHPFSPDINGSVVNIRNEVAKGIGGLTFLNAEAREYLTLWLKERDEYIRVADARMKGLVKAGANKRQSNDQRVFGMSYSSARNIFSRLYDKVDGGENKYGRDSCSLHSCRKYFRTHAARTMHPDLVTNLMRQSGYLDNTYVRTPSIQKEKEYHDGEAALYITRADHRLQNVKLSSIERENEVLKQRIAELEKAPQKANDMQSEIDELKRDMATLIRQFGKTVQTVPDSIQSPE